MSRRLLPVFAMCAFAPVAFAAGDSALDRATLRGLTGVNIVVDKIDSQLEAAGVKPDAVRSRLEDRLRAAGITVDGSKAEFVAVRMTDVRDTHGPFAVAITIGAYQPVVLARDKNMKTATQTWEVETVLLAEPKQLYRGAMDSIDDLAARFVAAYRSVNPQ